MNGLSDGELALLASRIFRVEFAVWALFILELVHWVRSEYLNER